MYYITEINYVGPNPEQHIDADRIEIVTEPPRENMSKEICIDGWCGTTNDWSMYAHGEYETPEAAEAAVETIFGECRELSLPWKNEDAVRCYKQGRLARYGWAETVWWCSDRVFVEIAADTTDEQIQAFVEAFCDEALEYEVELTVDAVRDTATARRDELREETADE